MDVDVGYAVQGRAEIEQITEAEAAEYHGTDTVHEVVDPLTDQHEIGRIATGYGHLACRAEHGVCVARSDDERSVALLGRHDRDVLSRHEARLTLRSGRSRLSSQALQVARFV